MLTIVFLKYKAMQQADSDMSHNTGAILGRIFGPGFGEWSAIIKSMWKIEYILESMGQSMS